MGSKARHIRRQVRRVQVALGIMPTKGSLGRLYPLDKGVTYIRIASRWYERQNSDPIITRFITDPTVIERLVKKYIKVGFEGGE